MRINGLSAVETPYTRLIKEKIERGRKKYPGFAPSAGESLDIPVSKREKKKRSTDWGEDAPILIE